MSKLLPNADILTELKKLATEIVDEKGNKKWLVKEFNLGFNNSDLNQADKIYINGSNAKKVPQLDFINSKNSFEIDSLINFLTWAKDWYKANCNNRFKFDQFNGRNSIYNQLDLWIKKDENTSSSHLPDIEASKPDNDDLPF